jgi:uncharacterized membrane protein YgdD (TMEM256/DUF423 family)
MAWIVVAAISGTVAVLLGAFGAHGLERVAGPAGLEAWGTASEYHLLHSVALLALALFAAQTERSIRIPAALFSAGIVLFSGSIYALVLTGASWLGPITPLGGVSLTAGWLSLPTLVRRSASASPGE